MNNSGEARAAARARVLTPWPEAMLMEETQVVDNPWQSYQSHPTHTGSRGGGGETRDSTPGGAAVTAGLTTYFVMSRQICNWKSRSAAP